MDDWSGFTVLFVLAGATVIVSVLLWWGLEAFIRWRNWRRDR